MFNFAKRPMRRLQVLTVFLTLFLISASSLVLVTGCGGTDKKASDDESKPTWVQTVIYFGRNIPGGGLVSEEQFDKFLNDVVTKEFPKGLTAFDAYGQMQKDNGSVEKQSTKVVLLAHEKTSANSEAVKRIIDSYRKSFGTPQVMRTTIPIDVEFFQGAPASATSRRQRRWGNTVQSLLGNRKAENGRKS
jgi:hypothetical protein